MKGEVAPGKKPLLVVLSPQAFNSTALAPEPVLDMAICPLIAVNVPLADTGAGVALILCTTNELVKDVLSIVTVLPFK